MRRIFLSLIVVAILLFPATALAATETDLQLDCKSALLMDGNSGDILYEQNSEEICYPASVTKIMTLVLILEAVEDQTISLDDKKTLKMICSADTLAIPEFESDFVRNIIKETKPSNF